VEPLAEVGSDRVVADELESIVQVFAEVMRAYELPPAQIEASEEIIRGGGYAALRAPQNPERPVVECELGPDCLDRRTVTIRAGAPAAGDTIGGLGLWQRFRIRAEGLVRDGETVADPPDEPELRPGDALSLAGSAAAFAEAAPLFRVGRLTPEEATSLDAAVAERAIDTERTYQLASDGNRCAHVAETRRVHPSARGCEDCLRIGARWVHLRLCLTCGHVGCCDSSPNRHATAHFHGTSHPIVRSLEPGEEWAWCYVDEIVL